MMKQMRYHLCFPQGSFVPWLHLLFSKLHYAISDSILESSHKKEIYLSDAIAFTHLLTVVGFGKGAMYPPHSLIVENVQVNPKKGENHYWGVSA